MSLEGRRHGSAAAVERQGSDDGRQYGHKDFENLFPWESFHKIEN